MGNKLKGFRRWAVRNKPAGIRSLVYGIGKAKVGIEGLSVSRPVPCPRNSSNRQNDLALKTTQFPKHHYKPINFASSSKAGTKLLTSSNLPEATSLPPFM